MGKVTKKNTNKKNQISTKENQYHLAVIDAYFSNGFNGVRAVQEVKEGTPYNRAAVEANLILNNKSNLSYIRDKRNQLQKETSITPSMIAKELKGIATANITDLIGLTEAEIKQLNPDIQRAIKKVSNRVKIYRNKNGSEVEERTIQYELHDKLKALDSLSKYIGFYEADNRQKAVNINLNKLDVNTLNNVLNVITEGEEQASNTQ